MDFSSSSQRQKGERQQGGHPRILVQASATLPVPAGYTAVVLLLCGAAAGVQMAESLTEWLSRFDAERFEPAFHAKGLTTVQGLLDAKLSDGDLNAMGIAPLWKRTSILSGLAQVAQDAASSSATGWADFGEPGGGGGGTAQQATNFFSMAAPAPQPAPDLFGMLGDGAFTDKEEDRSVKLSFGIVQAGW